MQAPQFELEAVGAAVYGAIFSEFTIDKVFIGIIDAVFQCFASIETVKVSFHSRSAVHVCTAGQNTIEIRYNAKIASIFTTVVTIQIDNGRRCSECEFAERIGAVDPAVSAFPIPI